ncbi:hypothetical protein D3C84_593900 [compost metagenome]
MHTGQGKHLDQSPKGQLQRVSERRKKVQEFSRPAQARGAFDIETCEQPPAEANQQPMVARDHHTTKQPAEHRYRTDGQ